MVAVRGLGGRQVDRSGLSAELMHWPPPLGTHPTPPGAGIGPTIQIGEETVITVDTKAAGKGKVTCTVCTPDGSEVDVDVVENEDGTFDIFYTAPQPGKYVICVRFGGEHVPNSPFQVTVRRGRGRGVRAGLMCDDRVSSSCALLCRRWLGTSPRHSPHYGLSSWPRRTPTPRAVSRPGYGLAHLLPALGDTRGPASWASREALFCRLLGGTPDPPTRDPFPPAAPHSGPLSPLQAPERPLVGVNGLDVTSLRPFDLVIPFTIKKGEITGERGREGAREPQRPECANGLP